MKLIKQPTIWLSVVIIQAQMHFQSRSIDMHSVWLQIKLCLGDWYVIYVQKKLDKSHHKSTLVHSLPVTAHRFGLTFFKSVCDVVCHLSKDAGSRPPRHRRRHYSPRWWRLRGVMLWLQPMIMAMHIHQGDKLFENADKHSKHYTYYTSGLP